MQRSFIGIEIGGTKLQLVAGDADAQITARRRFTVDKAHGGAGIREQIAGALPELLKTTQPSAVGVGFGGPVDAATGQICCSHQIEGWSEFPIGEWLRGLTSLPVAVDNDANAAALGEAKRGAGLGRNPVFYVTLGSGVGGGLVVDGRIYHGAKPGEAEIGHVRLDRSGVIVEERCAGWAVDRKIRAACQLEPGSALARLTAGTQHGEARALAPALTQGDPLAQRILDEVADDLAFGLSHVTQLMHPEIIVIGGGLSLVGEPLRVAVANALTRYVMEAFAPGPQVVLAGLGEDAVPVGALILARTTVS
ncbi:MAG: ROK family protein [Proteobacteria bacterium]|nr:ROK family protein [Pseudomonadota bacterium]